MADVSVSNELTSREKTDEVSEALKERDDGRASISEETLQTKQTACKENEAPNPDASKNGDPNSASHTEESEQPKQKEAQQPVISTNISASSEPAPKIITGTAHVRSTTPVMVGARVVTATSSVQGAGATSLALVTQPVKMAVNQTRVTTLTPSVTLSRIAAPAQNVTVTRAPVPLQLPANFQVPQGKF